MDTFGKELLAMAAMVWVATEVIGHLTPKIKRELICLVLGPVTGVILYATGKMTVVVVHGSEWLAWITAAFYGLIATLVAAVGHQVIAKPVARKLPKKISGVGP